MRRGPDRRDLEGATRGGDSEGRKGGAVRGGEWWRLEPRPARRQMEKGIERHPDWKKRESKEEAPRGLGPAGTQTRAARPGGRPVASPPQ